MFKRALLEAAAAAVAADGDDAVAWRALGAVDPLLRPLARRRLQKAMVRAIEVAPPDVFAGEGRGLWQLTYLQLAGQGPSGELAGDGASLERAFAQALPAGPPPALPAWWVTRGVVLVLVVVVAQQSYRHWQRSWPSPNLRPRLAPAGSHARGGHPRRGSPALQRILTEALPTYLTALDHWQSTWRSSGAIGPRNTAKTKLRAARKAVLGSGVESALGPVVARRLRDLLDAAEAVAGATGQVRPYARRVIARLASLNRALAALDLGYYLDGDVLWGDGARRTVILYSFAVERVRVYRTAPAPGGRVLRALELRRLDSLNFDPAALGFTRRQADYAVVLREQTEELLVGRILPGLARGRLTLADDQAAGLDWYEAVATRAASRIRQELAEGAGIPPDSLGRLIDTLGARHRLLKAWEAKLKTWGYGFAMPERLSIEWTYRRSLKNLATVGELDAMDAHQRRLSEPATRLVFARLHRLLLDSVSLHELQHRLDYPKVSGWEQVPELGPMVGPLRAGRELQDHARTAQAELSAYLAELAREPRIPHLNLALIAGLVLDEDNWGTADSAAAALIIWGLAREQGLSAMAAPMTLNSWARRRLAALYLKLLERPGAALCASAAMLWARWFGRPFAPLTEATAPR